MQGGVPLDGDKYLLKCCISYTATKPQMARHSQSISIHLKLVPLLSAGNKNSEPLASAVLYFLSTTDTTLSNHHQREPAACIADGYLSVNTVIPRAAIEILSLKELKFKHATDGVGPSCPEVMLSLWWHPKQSPNRNDLLLGVLVPEESLISRASHDSHARITKRGSREVF